MRAVGYPHVAGEDATIDAVLAGKSIARFGDGEFKLAKGHANVSQEATPELARELKDILVGKHKDCVIGIPTMDPRGPKYGKWSKYIPAYAALLNAQRPYYSAFITRPDSAPWINNKEFYDKVESLWAGQCVTLVSNGERSLKPHELTSAKHVHWIKCTYRDSYRDINRLCSEAMREGRRTLLCVGPTATCMAVRLSQAGIHAVDLGHIGMFWRPYESDKLKVPKAA